MISNLFGNLPTVTKNFLIINALMLFATVTFENQNINLTQMLGAHNFLSPLFQPYQVVTHFFMHGDLMHLIFNMFGLLMFGTHLERVWGSKRFFWFYIITALGSLALYAGFGTWEMYQVKQQILSQPDGAFIVADLNAAIREAVNTNMLSTAISSNELYNDYFISGYVPMVGASGAIYGILVGFAVLFPNTELMLMFPPIPIKAKYLVAILMVVALYLSFNDNTSNVAHLAHLGGGIVGFILVKWMNKDRGRFY